jgi:hypothetical protein
MEAGRDQQAVLLEWIHVEMILKSEYLSATDSVGIKPQRISLSEIK